MNINKTVFGLGLLIALTAATLLFLGSIESGVAAIIGIVGIGLIAASGRGKPRQKWQEARYGGVKRSAMIKNKRINRGIWVALILVVLTQVLFDPLSSLLYLGKRLQARMYLPTARGQWESQGITHYKFDIKGYFPLVCIFGGSIEVKDGMAIPGQRNAADNPNTQLSAGFSDIEEPPLCNYQNYTVPRLFDEIERWLQHSSFSITQISFDPQYGFISRFDFGTPGGRGLLSPTVSDCCGFISIENFQVLE